MPSNPAAYKIKIIGQSLSPILIVWICPWMGLIHLEIEKAEIARELPDIEVSFRY